MNYIIEGIDNLGKTTLIKNIIKAKGYHHVIHFGQPLRLPAYDNDLHQYSVDVCNAGFKTLQDTDNMIYDRFHLGESVYGPMYRATNPNFVFDIEGEYDLSNTRLILLVTDDFNVMKNDGLSIDYTRREEEQGMFIQAFTKSKIENKVMVGVNNANHYRPEHSILELSL